VYCRVMSPRANNSKVVSEANGRAVVNDRLTATSHFVALRHFPHTVGGIRQWTVRVVLVDMYSRHYVRRGCSQILVHSKLYFLTITQRLVLFMKALYNKDAFEKTKIDDIIF